MSSCKTLLTLELLVATIKDTGAVNIKKNLKEIFS